MSPRFTVEQRAERFRRRYSGPWKTRFSGPVVMLYRRQRRIEWVRMDVALHDLQRAFERELFAPAARFLAHPCRFRRAKLTDAEPTADPGAD